MSWSGTMLKKCLCILIVSLNAGDKLKSTLDSILEQDYKDYNIIIKDGGSNDGSLDLDVINQDNIKLVVSKDTGIYDGMNQAVKIMKQEQAGNYCMFLNCGDSFYDKHVLSQVSKYLIKEETPTIIYGDQYNLLQKTKVSSAPEINDFTLFRNVPCHQVCFYDVRLFENRAYDTAYKVRADYEHFLYSFYNEHALCKHVDVIICNYEGGGFSETKENREKSAIEHREITDKYMKVQAKKYRLIMALTLAPLRTKLSESKTFSGIYNSIKSLIYRK